MTHTESISLEHEFTYQPEDPGGLDLLAQEGLESATPAANVMSQMISGFWHRLIAFAIDVLILAALGFVIGAVFFNALAHLGTQGIWVGLLIAIGYFGLMNSSVNDGQTLGKRIMKIRVVDVLGNTIPLGRSIKRSTLFLVPLMYSLIEQSSLDQFFWVITLFILAATVYLYIFNSRTRQSVHDLALKTFVVRADYNMALAESPVPTRHLMFMSLAGVLVVGFSIFAWPQMIEQYTAPGISSTLAQLQKDPDVYGSTVKRVIVNSPEGRITKMEIAITVKKLPAPIYLKAKQISELAMQEMPDVRDMDSLSVTVNYGYNIGIAWYLKGLTYTGTPADWETNTVRIAKSAQTDVSIGIGK